MKTELLVYILTGFLVTNLSAQNLLEEDYNNWTAGRAPTPGFNNMGDDEENLRKLGENPFGETSLLWEATPAPGDNNNGGFFTDFYPVDHTKEYRLSVWIKKTGTSTGTSFMGPYAFNNGIVTLDGEINNNPLSLAYTLPEQDVWYLAVAFLRASNDFDKNPKGRLYATDGTEIGMLRDYRFAQSAISAIIRVFLFYDTTLTNHQYHFAPRMEQVNGLEPTIEELLRPIAPPEELVFNYDTAGNQVLRRTPSDPVNRPQLRNTAFAPLANSNSILTDPDLELLIDETPFPDELEVLEQSIAISPNPTRGRGSINWSPISDLSVRDVTMSDLSGKSIPIDFEQFSFSATFDISQYPPAIYTVAFMLSDGRTLNKKVVKK